MTASRHFTGAVLAAAALWMVAVGPAAAQDLGRGAELYELCAQCHGPAGEGNREALAPSIAGLQTWYVAEQLRKFRGAVRGRHPADVAGLRMHPMALTLKSDRDIEDVAAYAGSLPAVRPEPTLQGGDPQRGQAYYAPCIACHGPGADGNEALLSPRLWAASDWYLLSSLQRYKSGVRGSDPRNANAQIMRGMAATLPDEQAMLDVVAYIMSLPGTE